MKNNIYFESTNTQQQNTCWAKTLNTTLENIKLSKTVISDFGGAAALYIAKCETFTSSNPEMI